MDAAFTDLDIWVTRVRNPKSKTYFLESVRAYKSGALRAALTSVWVALAFDLIAKYRELSAMGDPAAASFLTNWDAATASDDVKALLKLESSILSDAVSNTQMISHIAGRHLERLREDRHLCAHPAFSTEAELFEPTPELVRLHLVNAVDLVLSREPLQGKAIFDFFDLDVQSSGFPTDQSRILDYVQQRYLERVRDQNIRNFGSVLVKSLLKGVPSQWGPHDRKVAFSLLAIRERAKGAWPDIRDSTVLLLDNLEPALRPRAIAFLALFPDFWPLLQVSTQTALQETAEKTVASTLVDYRILSGIALPQFRQALSNVVENLPREQLGAAIAISPLPEFWARALALYSDSKSYRGSEAMFQEIIAPFSGHVDRGQHDDLLEAVRSNGQNWDASETDLFLLEFLRNSERKNLPSFEARNAFCRFFQERGRSKYDDVIEFLKTDGWSPPLFENNDGSLDV
ncbi:hypothetical protein [Rhizobium sp.]|uniref:hypothetical protein n=1 Tax=Rhizobium sp. TaxID=391 RepID=UPI000DD53EE3